MSRILQFQRYLYKVFKYKAFLRKLEDGRFCPEISIARIVEALLYGSALRIRSIQEIERQCREGILKGRIGPISDDTFGYGLDHVDSSFFFDGWMAINKIIKRNGMLRQNAFKGLIVGVFDGIETLSSYSRCCGRCLERIITINGEDCIQYYHREVVLSLSGFDHPIPIAMEMMRPGEGEVECALRLLKRVVDSLGPRFLDIVIGDALYCTPTFFETCQNLGVHAGSVLKDNQKSLLTDAAGLKQLQDPVYKNRSEKADIDLWDIRNVHWDTADINVRVIWADRTDRVTKEFGKERQLCLEVKKNVYAFSSELNHLNPRLIYQIGRHRQDIDSILFQNLTQNCFLKHPTLHFENAYENLLIIRMLAFVFMAFFFHRHINSRRIHLIESLSILVRDMYKDAIIDSRVPT